MIDPKVAKRALLIGDRILLRNAIPMVSVIMPAHNAARHVARAIRSVLNQRDFDAGFELIVIDDGSTDRTADAITLYQDSIRLLSHERRRGLPASLNAGIQQARGKYIVRVDADDYVTGDYLYILYRFLETNPHMDAVACDYLVVDESEKVLERRNCSENPIGCGIMFRVDHLIDIGLYDHDFLMHEDADLRARFLAKYGIFRIELPLYRYRRHDSNMTNDRGLSDEYARRLKDKHSKDIVPPGLKES